MLSLNNNIVHIRTLNTVKHSTGTHTLSIDIFILLVVPIAKSVKCYRVVLPLIYTNTTKSPDNH